MAQSPYSNDYFQVPSRAQKIATTLRNWGHRVASIPVLSLTGFGPLLVGAAALLDAGDAMATKKDVVEATKSLMSGAADTAATFVLGFGGPIFWLANPFSWLVTGDSLPEHVRNASKWVLDMFDNDVKQPDPRTVYARNNAVLGYAPRTIGNATAGVGFAPGLQREINPYSAPLMPENYFTNTIAQQRGQDPEAMRANWLRNEENRMSHQELLAAREAQPGAGQARG